MGKIVRIVGITAVIVTGVFGYLRADTLYLKNGREIKGFVKAEKKDSIEFEVGGGRVVFLKSEIDRIEKSSPQDSARLYQRWEEKKAAALKEAAQAKNERQEELEQWRQKKDEEEKERLLRASRKNEVPIIQDKGHIFVEALLNNQISLNLLVDTGATLMVITEETAQKLRIDTSSLKTNIEVQMGDGRKVLAKYTNLKSVKIENFAEQDVETAILPGSAEGIAFGEGILGMSFLRRYSTKIDLEHNRLILERL